MKKSLQIGSAFIGIVVGAGFVSGQEILLFFTSYGYLGIAGSILATVLLAFFGMSLTQLGSRLQTTSHEKVIYHICGPYLGFVIDMVITCLLFGITMIMFAGAGVVFEEQFGISALIGSLIMAIITIISVMLGVQKVIGLIGAITPFLLVIVLIIAAYSVFHYDTSVDFKTVSAGTPPPVSHWGVGAFLYVSYNIAAGVSMITVIAGTVKNQKVAGWGGMFGGLGLGLLILLINISMLTQIDSIGNTSMPMVTIANNMHPIIGFLMAIILIGMIYNTAVAMLYAFSARIIKPGKTSFKAFTIFSGVFAFFASSLGFVYLIGTIYPVTGYLGILLIGAILISWFTYRRKIY
ncbi:YkvI family membrane protein [Psychrobacillus lasiicapitis]|uniref:Transporter n=1 Tax=Psychrobacillus lasiicapitis TaxID=1636719 RepID=A0A544T2S3_9BACI|nr:hypothetical protein [Psychrobacillus lasiicapitis]TQR11728.1 hypothetical protein FG382_14010 [Psychrobacillus lasiicapitis]GGA19020.1 membrane protein [Psychrobacillus lasiicapitis]